MSHPHEMNQIKLSEFDRIGRDCNLEDNLIDENNVILLHINW